MFKAIKRFLSGIEIINSPKEITIKGIPYLTIVRDIGKVFKTNKIAVNMINDIGKNTISFPPFFAIEIVHIIDQLLVGKYMKTDKRTLARVRELLMTQTWLANTTRDDLPKPLDLSKLKDLDLTPLDFQMEFFENYNSIIPKFNLRGMSLAAAPGSGKTYTTLALAHCAGATKVIIVAPLNSVNRVWETNIKLRFNNKKSYWLSNSGKPLDVHADVCVYHYEALTEALKNINHLKSQKVVIVLDESHNLSELTSQRTQNFILLCDLIKPEHIIEASGTPIKMMGSEAIPLLRVIDPLFTPEVAERFKAIYGKSATKGLEILKHRMGIISFIVEKSRLGLEDPNSNVILVKTPDSDKYTLTSITNDVRKFIEQRKQYYRERESSDTATYFRLVNTARLANRSSIIIKQFDEYLKTSKFLHDHVIKGFDLPIQQMSECTKFENANIIPLLSNEDKKLFRDIRSIYKYVFLKIQGEALGRIIGRSRIDCHLSMVEHMDFQSICNSTEKKTLIFTSYVEVLEKVQDICSKQDLNPLVVYAKTNSDLAKIIQSFETDIDLNPLVATYKSLSTAVPLTMADTMILIDSPFRTYILEQTISRIHRLGADTQVVVHTCLLDTGIEPNISTRSADILRLSQEMVEQIMGIKAPFVIDESEYGVTIANESLGIDNSIYYTNLLPNVIYKWK